MPTAVEEWLIGVQPPPNADAVHPSPAVSPSKAGDSIHVLESSHGLERVMVLERPTNLERAVATNIERTVRSHPTNLLSATSHEDTASRKAPPETMHIQVPVIGDKKAAVKKVNLSIPPYLPEVLFSNLHLYPREDFKFVNYYWEERSDCKPVVFFLAGVGLNEESFPEPDQVEMDPDIAGVIKRDKAHLFHPSEVCPTKKPGRPYMQKEIICRAILRGDKKTPWG